MNGLIAPPDAAGLALAAARAVEDAGLRRALGEAARKAALARQWGDVLDEVLRSYAALLEQRR